MSEPKVARIVRSESVGVGYHEIEAVCSVPLHYKAGQYTIMHSNLPHPTKLDSVMKKAFSFSSTPDPERPEWFTMTVATVGPMSGYLASRQPGDEIRFSGPWGKFVLGDEERPLHLVATGSGFSPIGALAGEAVRRGRGGHGTLYWDLETPYHADRIRQWSERARLRVVLGPTAPSAVPADPDADYFLAGSGAVIAGVCDRLAAEGVPQERIRVEIFYKP